MKITKNYNTTTYELKKEWKVDIVTTNETYEAWLYNKKYGIKSMMFVIPKENINLQEFLQLVKNQYKEYIDDYMYYFA